MYRFIILSILFCNVFTSHGQEIKVMTYNIRFDNPGDGVNAWPTRKNNVFNLLAKYHPDLIGVQEALKHQLDDIVAKLPEYKYVGVGRDDGKTQGEYSAILYRQDKFKVLEEQTFWLSENPDQPGSKSWDAAITRIVTLAKITETKSARSFYLINTHFDHIGTEARKNSALLIKKKASELEQWPVIITGDFNCTRDEEPYKALMAKNGVRLIDPAPHAAPGTFCTFEVNSAKCIAIDYIFHDKRWESSEYNVIQDNDGKYYPSDHLPVMVNLSLKD